MLLPPLFPASATMTEFSSLLVSFLGSGLRAFVLYMCYRVNGLFGFSLSSSGTVAPCHSTYKNIIIKSCLDTDPTDSFCGQTKGSSVGGSVGFHDTPIQYIQFDD